MQAYEEATKRGLVKPASQSVNPLSFSGMQADEKTLTQDVDPYLKQLRGMDADVDYDTGASSALPKWWLARSDNPKEAQLALEHFYGPGNVGQDASGRWWVRQDGKKVEVYGGGQGLTTAGKHMLYDTLAYSPVLGGAAVGAGIAGGAASETVVGALPAAILGAGAGAASGKAIDELIKALQGVYAKTPYEELQRLGNDAIWNMTFETLSPAARAVLGPLKKGLRSFFGITEQGEAMTRRISGPQGGKLFRKDTDQAGVPPLKTAVPGLVGLQWHQDFRNRVMGDPQAVQNVAYIRTQLQHVLEDSGYPPDQVNSIMEELTRKDAAQSSLSEGKMITSKVEGHIQSLQREAESAVTTAKAATSDEIKALRDLGAQDPGPLGKDIASSISQARSRFGAAMTRAYDHVTAMTGGQSIVSTAEVKAQVGEVLDTLPETAHPPILKKIMDLPATVTLKDAHAYRSQLRQAAWSGNLTPGLTAHNLNDAASSIDEAISSAGADLESRGETNVAKALRGVDAAYAEGIAKFRDTMFNQTVRRARTGIFQDAGTVAAQYIRPGEGDRLRTLFGLMPPELRTRVGFADMANIQKEAKGTSEGFLDAVRKRGDMLDTVYGKDNANKLRTAAKALAALDGKLPSDMTLEPGRALSAIERQVKYTNELDKFVSENPIAALGIPKAADRAVRFITAPGRENVTREALTFFGKDSAEWKTIQTYALKGVLSRAMVQSADLAPTVVGPAMKEALSKYTRGQLDMLFPGGLENDLRDLADKAEFLFPPRSSDMSAGLAAGTLKAFLPWSAPAWVYAKMWGWVADHPIWFHNLASVARSGDVNELKAIRKAIYRMAILPMQAGPGSGRVTPSAEGANNQAGASGQ